MWVSDGHVSLVYGRNRAPVKYAILGPTDLREVLPKAKSFCDRSINNRVGRHLMGH